jgi:hypothetical protein
MANTISLAELGGHLGDAKKIIDEAMDSTEETPEVSFAALRKSLKSALELLGEKTATTGTASDSARPKYSLDHRVKDIFTPQPVYRNQ